jgi:uncharacterized protein
MPVPGLHIARPPPAEAPLAARADVALFVGEIAFRQPTASQQDKPCFVTSFAAFADIFDWQQRSVDGSPGLTVPTTLGLAVQSFFAEGGQSCHILRTMDPPALSGDDAPGPGIDPLARLNAILPDPMPGPDRPSLWRGITHLHGLADVALLLIPDLPEIFAAPRGLVKPPSPPAADEVFRPLMLSPDLTRRQDFRPPVGAPRLDGDGATRWAAAVGRISAFLGIRPDVTVLLSVPLAKQGVKAPTANSMLAAVASIAGGSTQLQLIHPWIETTASLVMPEGVIPADGAVAGVIARNALLRGGFRSAAGQSVTTARRVHPSLERREIEVPQDKLGDWLGASLTLIGKDGQGQPGFSLLSDTMISYDSGQRAGSLQRLRGIIIRAARQAGEPLLFEPSGASTWARLRHRFEDLMDRLWRLNALDGVTAADAYQVRCDRSTMTQSDMDAGRLVAAITFTTAEPVQRITLRLALGGASTADRRAA